MKSKEGGEKMYWSECLTIKKEGNIVMDPFVKTPFFDLLVGDPRSFS